MTTITVPSNMTKDKDLIVVSRKEYEEFSEWKKFITSFKTFIPTAAQKKDIRIARQDYKRGRHITIHELKHKLAITS